MIIRSLFVLLLFTFHTPIDLDKDTMVMKVNNIRTEGCKCGRSYMPPVDKLTWNEKLYASAISHAKDMSKYSYFSHVSRKGKDVGERVEKYEYNWQVVGENIAEGQRNFDEVLSDWLKSPSHCKMIMDGKVNEMGIGRSGRYWVQHFGKQKPNRN